MLKIEVRAVVGVREAGIEDIAVVGIDETKGLVVADRIAGCWGTTLTSRCQRPALPAVRGVIQVTAARGEPLRGASEV